MPNKNLKRVGLKSGTRPKPLAPRTRVERADRVGPTPETVDKLAEKARMNGGHACILQAMKHIGITDPGNKAGMTQQQFDAALQIWDANDALVKGLKAGAVDVDKIANAHGGLSDGKARLVQIYLQWASELGGRYYLTSGIVLGWINDEPHERMTNDQQRFMLTRACDHWIKVKQAHDRANRVERSTIVHEREMVAA